MSSEDPFADIPPTESNSTTSMDESSVPLSNPFAEKLRQIEAENIARAAKKKKAAEERAALEAGEGDVIPTPAAVTAVMSSFDVLLKKHKLTSAPASPAKTQQ